MKPSPELESVLALVRRDARRMKGTVQRLQQLFPDNEELQLARTLLTRITKRINIKLEGDRGTGPTPED